MEQPLEIRNAAKRPLKVPLPGGKKLFLGIGKTGQIVPKAAEHPALKKLLDAGELEIIDSGHVGADMSTGRDNQIKSSPSRGGSQASRQSGDR